ncbi:MAG TPA: glycosyltransferase [Chloroflexota bacterium]|jgi:glycosyltransferase involved in cell wall biosynthesis
MRALFYLLDGDSNASSYHRALQFFPLLRQHGIEATASRPVPNTAYDRLVEGRAAGLPGKSAFYSLFLVCRSLDVLRADRFDVVVIQRDLFPFGPPILERALRRRNPHVVYDTDDAAYLRPSFTPATPFQKLRRFDKVAEVVRHARWVSVATEPIAAWARAFNPRVCVVPMAVDLRAYDSVPRTRHGSGGPIVLGWAGTAGGIRYLNALAPVLQRLAREHSILVRVISGGYAQVNLPDVAVDPRPWRAEDHLAQLASFDIGLVPLDDSPFEQAKFPFKLLQYLALGIPAVSARVGTAAHVIQHDHNGLLAATPDDWHAALARLIAEAELRQRLGSAGHDTVAQHYTVDRVLPLLVDGLASAAR